MTIRKIGDTNIFVGNSNDSRDINTQRRLGIRSVVNVAKDLEGPWFHGDFRNYKVSILDGPGNETYQYVLAAQIVLELLNNGEKVLLHCVGGVSRSPAIATMVLSLLDKNLSLVQSSEIVKQSRPCTHINAAHWPLMKQAYQRLIQIK
jgi:hypothetical protein